MIDYAFFFLRCRQIKSQLFDYIFSLAMSSYWFTKNHYNVAIYSFNLFRPEFTIVIFIHYKPRIAVAILDF